MEDIQPVCEYCQHPISSQEAMEILGGQCFHKHCSHIIGAEMNRVPWEKMTQVEQDALNLYLSQESYQTSEGE